MIQVAALYVLPNGPYSNILFVDPWDESRDARLYAGPWPVVAHPPCERWGRYWFGGPSARVRREKGDDNFCFMCALQEVREWGGVLEHPAGSSAWEAFGLNKPPRAGGWIRADDQGGWTCCVDQGHYGHRGQKATWLYACKTDLPELRWGKSESKIAREEGRRAIRTGIVQRMSHRQRKETPAEFRNLLIRIALSVK